MPITFELIKSSFDNKLDECVSSVLSANQALLNNKSANFTLDVIETLVYEKLYHTVYLALIEHLAKTDPDMTKPDESVMRPQIDAMEPKLKLKEKIKNKITEQLALIPAVPQSESAEGPQAEPSPEPDPKLRIIEILNTKLESTIKLIASLKASRENPKTWIPGDTVAVNIALASFVRKAVPVSKEELEPLLKSFGEQIQTKGQALLNQSPPAQNAAVVKAEVPKVDEAAAQAKKRQEEADAEEAKRLSAELNAAEKNQKKSQEEADAAFAKKMLEAEENEARAARPLVSEADEAYARELAEAEQRSAAQAPRPAPAEPLPSLEEDAAYARRLADQLANEDAAPIIEEVEDLPPLDIIEENPDDDIARQVAEIEAAHAQKPVHRQKPKPIAIPVPPKPIPEPIIEKPKIPLQSPEPTPPVQQPPTPLLAIARLGTYVQEMEQKKSLHKGSIYGRSNQVAKLAIAKQAQILLNSDKSDKEQLVELQTHIRANRKETGIPFLHDHPGDLASTLKLAEKELIDRLKAQPYQLALAQLESYINAAEEKYDKKALSLGRKVGSFVLKSNQISKLGLAKYAKQTCTPLNGDPSIADLKQISAQLQYNIETNIIVTGSNFLHKKGQLHEILENLKSEVDRKIIELKPVAPKQS